MLGRCRYNVLPFAIFHSREADESQRLKYRYLDLRRAKFSRTDIRFAKMQKTKIDLEGAVYLAGLLGAVVN